MADKLNVSLEPHLRDALAALLRTLPEETSQQLTPCLSSETNATVVPVIPYELVLKISGWCQTTDGKAALRTYSPPLGPQSYPMVSSPAGTRTSPEKHFPPYAAKDPEEDRHLQTKDRKVIATLVNATLSVVATGVATCNLVASGHAGMRLEWRMLLAVCVALVAALAEIALYMMGPRQPSRNEPVALTGDLSGDFGINKLPLTRRILDPALGGGALLDLHTQSHRRLTGHPCGAKPSNVTGTILKTPLTGVDRSTSFIVTFSPDSPSAPNTLAVQAVLSCNINAASHQTGVIVRYERGTIAITAPIYCPKSFTVQYFGEGKPGTVVKEETRRFEYVGVGWHFEADEVARCVRDGKAQSELWGHDKSLLEMEIFDEVRRQGGSKFPPGVEKAQ